MAQAKECVSCKQTKEATDFSDQQYQKEVSVCRQCIDERTLCHKCNKYLEDRKYSDQRLQSRQPVCIGCCMTAQENGTTDQLPPLDTDQDRDEDGQSQHSEDQQIIAQTPQNIKRTLFKNKPDGFNALYLNDDFEWSECNKVQDNGATVTIKIYNPHLDELTTREILATNVREFDETMIGQTHALIAKWLKENPQTIVRTPEPKSVQFDEDRMKAFLDQYMAKRTETQDTDSKMEDRTEKTNSKYLKSLSDNTKVQKYKIGFPSNETQFWIWQCKFAAWLAKHESIDDERLWYECQKTFTANIQGQWDSYKLDLWSKYKILNPRNLPNTELLQSKKTFLIELNSFNSLIRFWGKALHIHPTMASIRKLLGYIQMGLYESPVDRLLSSNGQIHLTIEYNRGLIQ